MIVIVLKGGESERGGVTCGKGPRVGFEPGSSASRTVPLYMGAGANHYATVAPDK